MEKEPKVNIILSMKAAYHRTKISTRRLFFRGNRLYCPICDRSYRKFCSFGVVPRPDALCPVCNSLERHRLLWIGLNYMSLLSANPKKRMLHVAPEACLSSKFKDIFEYVSIDLDASRALMQMDITQLLFPNGYFDAIVCNHVLEHVPEDRKALSELHRVLKPGGWACIQVPIEGSRTEEDTSLKDPSERARRFGQSDHVRNYGRDFLHRLEDAGFSVNVLTKQDLLNLEMLKKISVECEDEVWISLKKR